jgi:hypothetical protein
MNVRTASFASSNNARPLRTGEYRVWRYGESAIVRSAEKAGLLVRRARVIDPDAHAVNADGVRL